MFKSAAIVLLIALLLTGCNMPGQAPLQATPEGTLSVDEVATQVGVLLTAQPTATTAPTQAAPPTATLAPSMTPLPPTATPVLPSSTPVATQAAGPQGPAAGLGEPVWRNPFDSGKGFGLNDPYEDENTRFEVRNGRIEMTGRKANGWHGWRLTSPKITNFYLEAVATTGTCAGDDTYGLVFRAPDFDSGRGYYFGVSCDGRYMLGEWEHDGVADVIGLTQNSAIISGSNQTNRLGVRAQGSKIGLYANGTLLQELEDSTFGDAGNFGVWVAAFDTAGFTVSVDEIAYWNIQ